MIVFAVCDAGARGDALHVTGAHNSLGTHAVLMLQGAADNVTDNFEVAMGVRAEAFPALDSVLVNHPQTAKSHMPRVVIIRKGKRMVTIQPPVVRMSPLFGSPNIDHV